MIDSLSMSLSSLIAAEVEKDTPFERVETGTKDYARLIVIHVCYSNPHFTMDDVWRAAEEADFQGFAAEPRAWGAVIRAVESEEFCAVTEDWHLSEREMCHHRPMRVWKSLVAI